MERVIEVFVEIAFAWPEWILPALKHIRSVVRMFSILYINTRSVSDTEHYEISITKTTASAGQAHLEKTRRRFG